MNTNSSAVGWTGRHFEDFTVGDVYRHALGRTVTATDDAWLTLLTQHTAPPHFDTQARLALTSERSVIPGPSIGAVEPEWDRRALAAVATPAR